MKLNCLRDVLYVRFAMRVLAKVSTTLETLVLITHWKEALVQSKNLVDIASLRALNVELDFSSLGL